MIYVITEPRYVSSVTIDDLKSGRSYETEPCIKIGYSSNFESRKLLYTTDTPRFDILYTYDDGSEEDEKRLHQYFGKFRKDDLNGVEWFSLSTDIIEFFEVNTTIEQIREVLNENNIEVPLSRHERKRRKKLSYWLTPLVNIIIDLGLEKDIFPPQEIDDKSWLDRFNLIMEHLICIHGSDKVLAYLQRTLPESSYATLFSAHQDYLSKESDMLSSVKEFRMITNYDRRMEYVCKLGERIDTEKFNLFLSSIPGSFKHYYTTLGPATCRARKYQIGLMEKEYYRQLHNQGVELNGLIYETFQVGKRYSSKEAKIMLAELYKKVGYLATAKATDLKSWFDLKLVLFTEKGTGKRFSGYELLKRLK